MLEYISVGALPKLAPFRNEQFQVFFALKSLCRGKMHVFLIKQAFDVIALEIFKRLKPHFWRSSLDKTRNRQGKAIFDFSLGVTP